MTFWKFQFILIFYRKTYKCVFSRDKMKNLTLLMVKRLTCVKYFHVSVSNYKDLSHKNWSLLWWDELNKNFLSIDFSWDWNWLRLWYKNQWTSSVVALLDPISQFQKNNYYVSFLTQLTTPQTNLWNSSYAWNKTINSLLCLPTIFLCFCPYWTDSKLVYFAYLSFHHPKNVQINIILCHIWISTHHYSILPNHKTSVRWSLRYVWIGGKRWNGMKWSGN